MASVYLSPPATSTGSDCCSLCSAVSATVCLYSFQLLKFGWKLLSVGVFYCVLIALVNFHLLTFFIVLSWDFGKEQK